jgi:cyclase
VQFRDHRVVGDILELAQRYRDQDADELVFYDITASPKGRSVDRSWIARVAQVLRPAMRPEEPRSAAVHHACPRYSGCTPAERRMRT